MNQELPREPRFYPNNETIILNDFKTTTLRIPTSRSYRGLVVNEEGICKRWDELDQYGEVIYGTEELVLSKEVFIAAYNAYIKGGEV